MEKTPIQELYERVEKMLAFGGDDDLRAVWIHCKVLEEKEKQMVIEAYCECWGADGGNANHKEEEAKQYYNDKYTLKD